MEELFKINIKNTEAAGVEIVPTADGVEIVVTRRQAKVESKPSSPDNVEILRKFCSSKKNEEGVDRAVLHNFWDWYSERMEDWKGRIMPEKLWERWLTDEKKYRKNGKRD